MKPPRLSRAQWELLRKLPDSGGQSLRWPALRSSQALKSRGLVAARWHDAVSDWLWWRTAEGRALIEASNVAESLCQDEVP